MQVYFICCSAELKEEWCVLDLKLPEKTGCRQPGSSVTALTKSALSGAAVLWDI